MRMQTGSDLHYGGLEQEYLRAPFFLFEDYFFIRIIFNILRFKPVYHSNLFIYLFIGDIDYAQLFS